MADPESPSREDATTSVVAVGARAVYDAIAPAYDRQLGNELERKPLDRGLLDAFAALTGSGPIADVGCGPGHVTRFLALRHPAVFGLDLSPGMIAVTRSRAPELPWLVGSMLRLPVADGALAGVLALYSIIHLSDEERTFASREFARTTRPGGWLLVAFHVDSDEFARGEVNHLTSWFGARVELDGHFLEPDGVVAEVEEAGFEAMAKLERQPDPEVEYPSRRCYLLARRR